MGLIVSKGQANVRSSKVNIRKCCMSVVQHMFYGSFGTQNTMVAFSFRFDPRKGEYKVKLGQKGSNFQNKKYSKNMLIVSSFVSEFQKWDLFLRTAIRNTKNAFQKVASSPLPVF